MYHYSNESLYQHSSYQQQHCPLFEPTKGLQTLAPGALNNAYDVVPQYLPPTPVKSIPEQPETQGEIKGKLTAKGVVDTSTFSIEQRLVAAVWVHERKNTKSSMSQIKQEFRQRFGRDPPAKNTLLVWERKLFSTGSVRDAPRPGRPVNRTRHMNAVSASLHTAPALSLRGRAAALRLPRSTLAALLRDRGGRGGQGGRGASGKRQARPRPPPDHGGHT